VALAASILLGWACTGGAGNDEATQAQEERMAMTAELEQKRQVRGEELRAMPADALADELDAEAARGVEPFNSTAYAEAVSRGEAAAPALKQRFEGGQRSSYLTLLALRSVSPPTYGEVDPTLRTGVLVDALAGAETFNAWGLPHQYWEDAAEALIAEGTTAAQALRPLLDDCRPAPLWGSEEVLASREYGYRLCDYALALIREIAGEDGDLPKDPAERDRLRAQLAGPSADGPQ
jgi:hypothetical protein